MHFSMFSALTPLADGHFAARDARLLAAGSRRQPGTDVLDVAVGEYLRKRFQVFQRLQSGDVGVARVELKRSTRIEMRDSRSMKSPLVVYGPCGSTLTMTL